MPTRHPHQPPSALRRRLAALPPGRATAIACAIAIALGAADLGAPFPERDTPLRGGPGAAQLAAESPVGTVLARGGLPAHNDRSAPADRHKAAP